MERSNARPGLLAGPRRAAGSLDDIGENIGALTQATKIALGDGLQNLRATRAKGEHHPPSIGLCVATGHQIALDQARDQFDGAMVLDQQAFSQVADRDRIWSRVSPDGQQRLMLLSGQAVVASALLAESQELADGATKLPQSAIVVLGEGRAVDGVLRKRGDRRRHDQIQKRRARRSRTSTFYHATRVVRRPDVRRQFDE